MKKRVVSIKKIIIFIILLLVVIISSILVWYKINIGKVSSNDKSVAFEVSKNDTYISISNKLKKQNLIKNVLAYKIYLKLNKPVGLQVGTYSLKENMTVKDIISELSKGSNINNTDIKLTFKEGINVRKFAEVISTNTEHKKEDVLSLLKDSNFLDKLISKYWFLNSEIKNKNIYYSLEGYLYPDTYMIKKDATLEDIIITVLNNTDIKLTPYKDSINKTKYTVHEILTLASIVELEASTNIDRKQVAGVFYNRLKRGMGLESDVTTYYALKKELTESIVGHVYDDNPYNTRNSKLNGKLPVGPISNPSISSIDAVINYEKVDYLYFVADKNKKVYFTKTYTEHLNMIKNLKDRNLWNG